MQCQCGCGNVVFVSHDGNGNTCIHTKRPTHGKNNKELLRYLINIKTPIEVQMEMSDAEKIEFCTQLLDGIARVVEND